VFAHVLFMDVVGSSKLESDKQQQIVRTLQEMVRSTNEFQRARSRDEVLSLPTGDGMALVFYRRLEAPVLCAIEIARKLNQEPICQLRFGVNSGPIFELADINGNANVSGSGINRAERVMSCGTGGHILISDQVADSLSQISRWRASIHDCGECRVKDGWLRVFNVYEADYGNPQPPSASRRSSPNRAVIWGGAAAALIILVLLLLLLGHR